MVVVAFRAGFAYAGQCRFACRGSSWRGVSTWRHRRYHVVNVYDVVEDVVERERERGGISESGRASVRGPFVGCVVDVDGDSERRRDPTLINVTREKRCLTALSAQSCPIMASHTPPIRLHTPLYVPHPAHELTKTKTT